MPIPKCKFTGNRTFPYVLHGRGDHHEATCGRCLLALVWVEAESELAAWQKMGTLGWRAFEVAPGAFGGESKSTMSTHLR
jgi:hypothetical protein